jgi:Ca2+-binding EF-hand superfamily protein
MNETRLDIVTQAFQYLDEDSKGYIPLETLLKKYIPEGHTRVRMKDRTVEDVYEEFKLAMEKKA